MRITIEIEDGAVRAAHAQGTGPHEATDVGGPPAELVKLLGARPGPQTAGRGAGGAVNVGGPPEELLRALGRSSS
jgi:hypothetical protein